MLPWEKGNNNWEEFPEFLRLDWVVKGRPRWVEKAPWVWLAMEVSVVVDRHDVCSSAQARLSPSVVLRIAIRGNYGERHSVA